MSYDYDRLFSTIFEVVERNDSIQARMLTLIDACEEQFPHSQWSEMRRLDFETDRVRLRDWLDGAIADAAVGLVPKGLWFGLFNPEIDGVMVADIYAGVSAAFADGSLNWARQFPKPHDLGSAVLRNIAISAYHNSDCLENSAEYPLALAYGAIAARETIEACNTAHKWPSLQGAVVGFDSGDAIRLGHFSNGRFRLELAVA